MSNWFKLSSYNYIEDLENQLMRVMAALSSCKSRDCLKYAQSIQAAYNNLIKYRNRPFNDVEFQKARYVADSLLETISSKIPEIASRQPLSQQVLDTSRKSNWYVWEQEKPLESRISLIRSSDKSQPPKIKIEGFDLGKSDTAQRVRSTMGGWVSETVQEIPGQHYAQHDIYIRGTKESWNRFVGLLPLLVDRHEVLVKSLTNRLPSEKDFNPSYEEPVQEQPPTVEKIFDAFPLNNPSRPDSLSSQIVGKAQPKQGIRLQFHVQDPSLYEIRDVLIREEGMTGVRVNIPEGYFDVFDDDQKKWARVSKKLQFRRYGNIKKLNELIAEFTGKTTGLIYQDIAVDEKSKPLKDTTVRTALNNNLIRDEAGNIRPDVAARFGEWGNLSEEDYGVFVEMHYPNAFQVPLPQQVAQKKGMYFIATREVSIISDEPGSGKTAQAIVAADSVRDEGQKILIIAPNATVKENWTGSQAKGPMFFVGHAREQVVEARDPASVLSAFQNPDITWIVVPMSAFKRQDSRFLVKAIRDAASADKIAAAIIDEIQTIKDPDARSYQAIKRSIAHGIAHKIGLTGTPSDNDPDDIYSQLELLRHRLLYNDKGLTNKELRHQDLVIRQNRIGFANQFLGGEEHLYPINLSKEERLGLDNDQQAIAKARKAFGRAKAMLAWVKNLTDVQKIQILDLFGATYLRRNKKDIRPDMPEKKVIPNALPFPPEIDDKSGLRGWHIDQLGKMAVAKIPYTVQKALDYLKDPAQKVFIITKHPKIAQEIVKRINEQMGEGASAFVEGDTGEEERELIPDVFRMENGILPNMAVPLRAVVYTMKLGSVGLNLGSATKAIFNDMDFNPSTNLQAEYRIHRIDSPKPVSIDYMYFQDSYDEDMYKMVLNKQKINENMAHVIQRANTANPAQKTALANQFLFQLVSALIMDPSTPSSRLLPQDLKNIQMEMSTIFGASLTGKAANWYRRNLGFMKVLS